MCFVGFSPYQAHACALQTRFKSSVFFVQERVMDFGHLICTEVMAVGWRLQVKKRKATHWLFFL
jgi:hypothetical protein